MLKYYQYITEVKNNIPEIIKAAKNGSNAKVQQLIKKKVNINEQDENGDTALIEAVNGNFLMVVDTLLKAGADPNIQNKEKHSALMYARTSKIMEKLLNSGANVNLTNNNGRSVITLLLNNNINLLKILLNNSFALNINFDIKDINDNNFYDNIKNELERPFAPEFKKKELNEILKYMDEKYPQYKKEWDFKKAKLNYNL